jgi:hypothetical protein
MKNTGFKRTEFLTQTDILKTNLDDNKFCIDVKNWGRQFELRFGISE